MQPIQKYVEQNKIKLSQDEIRQLFQDKELNESKIIQSQLPLALKLTTNKCAYTSADIEDVFSYALEALKNAFSTYQPDNAASFTTYAKKCIENGINNYKLFNTNVIKQPSRNQELSKIKAFTFSSFVSDDETIPFENIPIIEDTRISDEDALIKLLQDNLKPSYSYIIIQYYGIGQDKPKTLKEIGELINTSRQDVEIKLKRILNKLKNNERFIYLLKKKYEL
ncbi:sigma-70 family RNA polymerase sigma factor [Olleya marilimosa]|uniref:sigma-70 family RNA polymerase sigma factor n=1 Tax=Olleya marilimosa TaxID=272164 RepID=UPI0030EB492E|tara:strand:+ start:100088 stop:100759 length:672 start_codon:yes stop_codon:yes gene_type:complete